MSEELVEHSVALSPAQVTKMKKGVNVTLAPQNFTSQGSHIIGVAPLTHKRILSAMRKGKGLKVSLKPAEGLYKKTVGGKISLKGISHSIKSGLNDLGRKAETGLKTVGKVTAKPMVDALIQGGIPAVAGIAGEALGGPLGGIAGSVAGEVLANQVQKEADKKGLGLKRRRGRKPAGGDLIHIDLGSHNGEVDGAGLYKSLSKLGISKRKAVNTFKEIGKNALRTGAMAIQAGLTEYGVSPQISGPLVGSLEQIAEKAIDEGTVKGVKRAGHQSVSQMKQMAKEQALEYLDRQLDQLPPETREVAEMALDKVQEREVNPQMIGAGANVYASLAYRTAMKRIQGGTVHRRAMVGGNVSEMTLSPFQSYASPAMHPFIPHKNELQGYNPIKGGSIYPAGYRSSGKGFYPSG